MSRGWIRWIHQERAVVHATSEVPPGRQQVCVVLTASGRKEKQIAAWNVAETTPDVARAAKVEMRLNLLNEVGLRIGRLRFGRGACKQQRRDRTAEQ